MSVSSVTYSSPVVKCKKNKNSNMSLYTVILTKKEIKYVFQQTHSMSLSLCNNIKPFDLSTLYTTICYAWWIYFSTDCRHTKQVNVNDIQYPTLMEIQSSTKVSTRVNMVRVCKDQSLTWTLLTIFEKNCRAFFLQDPFSSGFKILWIWVQ